MSTTIESGVGERISLLRASAGLSQRRFAELIGISPGYMSEVETGKKLPGSEVLIALKREFRVDINWLLAGEGEMQTGKDESVKASRADSLLAHYFTRFEAHELEMRDHQDQPGYVIPSTPPTRESVLEQFCGLYNQYGPVGVRVPTWMMKIYPTLNPDIVSKAIKSSASLRQMGKDEQQGRGQAWATVTPQDWTAWMAVITELMVNGITPADVLTQFRPPSLRAANPSQSPDTEVTDRMF